MAVFPVYRVPGVRLPSEPDRPSDGLLLLLARLPDIQRNDGTDDGVTGPGSRVYWTLLWSRPDWVKTRPCCLDTKCRFSVGPSFCVFYQHCYWLPWCLRKYNIRVLRHIRSNESDKHEAQQLRRPLPPSHRHHVIMSGYCHLVPPIGYQQISALTCQSPT